MLGKHPLLLLLANNGTIIVNSYLGFLEKTILSIIHYLEMPSSGLGQHVGWDSQSELNQNEGAL